MAAEGKQLVQHATFVHAELSIYANSLFLGLYFTIGKVYKVA